MYQFSAREAFITYKAMGIGKEPPIFESLIPTAPLYYSMYVGQAVLVEGMDDPQVVDMIHDDGTVTVEDLEQAAVTIDADRINEV